jgi:large conductance mechanosensitive channel
MGFLKEFMDFLNENKVIALAIAFIMGGATKDLVGSLVDNIIMPLANPLLSGIDFANASVAIGPFVFGIGAFVSSLLDFVILALVVFLVFKKLIGLSEKLKKKK